MIKLYLDEDVPETVGMALRLRGFNVATVKEAGRKGLTDLEQLKYAYSEQRVMFTHNIADFLKLHNEFTKKGDKHCGIILARQLSIGVIVKGLLKLLSNITASDIENKVIWLSDWIT